MKTINSYTIPTKIVAICYLMILSSSCKKFLDATPNQELSTITSMRQLRALMDNAVSLNSYYPHVGAIASDDYYITEKAYTSYTEPEAKSAYAWGLVQESSQPSAIWLQAYKRIMAANTVLDHFDQVDHDGYSLQECNTIKGEALFYRGFNFLQLSQVYCMPYHPFKAETEPGIALRLSSDINEPISRSSLAKTFGQVIGDLKAAIVLLPRENTSLIRPGKVAAYAALSNVYLVMGDYQTALLYADSALAIKSNLMDYNNFSLTTNNVIPLFNEETIWMAELSLSSILNTSRLIIDSNLYRSYLANDLRKQIFFKPSATAGAFTLKSNYNNYPTSGMFFNGFATDELFLIKAECLARLSSPDDAMSVLNQLLAKRFAKNSFTPLTGTGEKTSLDLILAERRKELCLRGMWRWMDLRRFNELDDANITPQRKIAGQLYSLEPGSLHYAFLIPQAVIDQGEVEQNKR